MKVDHADLKYPPVPGTSVSESESGESSKIGEPAILFEGTPDNFFFDKPA